MKVKMKEDGPRKIFNMMATQKFMDEIDKLRIHLGLNSKSDVIRILVRQEYTRLYGVEE